MRLVCEVGGESIGSFKGDFHLFKIILNLQLIYIAFISIINPYEE